MRIVFCVALALCGCAHDDHSTDAVRMATLSPNDASAVTDATTSNVDGSGPGGGKTMQPPAPGSCGLATPAFCETFDAPGATQGRAGELDMTRWSGSRLEVQLPTP